MTAKVAGTDMNFTSYQKTFNGQDVFLDLYRPGSGNTELALTYASFGRWRSSARSGVVTDTDRVYTDTDRVYFVYGLETPAGLLDARSGKGQYRGVAYGAASNDQTHALYDVKGTSRFDVDFGAQSLTGSLSLQGKSTSGARDVDFGTFDFGGRIGNFTGEAVATFTQDGAQYGSISTRFYGPDGEEIAGPFTLNASRGQPGDNIFIAGIAVAKRQ